MLPCRRQQGERAMKHLALAVVLAAGLFPGAALVLLCMSVNLIGDWLRDALNPRLR